jgi:hypothetical protein
MKCIAYATLLTDNREQITKKNAVIQEERKQDPNRYPKRLTDPLWMTISDGVIIYDGTEEQYMNLSARWIPELKFKYVLLIEAFPTT